jgi:hypothetical protein
MDAVHNVKPYSTEDTEEERGSVCRHSRDPSFCHTKFSAVQYSAASAGMVWSVENERTG